jgi:hypothetical protein
VRPGNVPTSRRTSAAKSPATNLTNPATATMFAVYLRTVAMLIMRCPLPTMLGLNARDRVDLNHVGITGGSRRIENAVLIGGAANIAKI